MKDTLKHRTIEALFWSFAEIAGLRGIQFVISIILARLLQPEQFGLIGMLVIFMAIAETFMNSGFGSALIQKQNASQTDICSVFYFNIVIGIIVVGLFYIIAPWVAAFYKQPVLSPLLRTMSVIIFINSFGLIQTTIITKHINFRILTKVSISSSIISGIIGVLMALYGFGVWSLAIQQITRVLFQSVLLWFFNTWRPSLLFSIKSLREMFSFGSRMFASAILEQTFQNIYLLVIGRLFSAADLGYYTRARTMQDLPSQTIAGMVGRVSFPVFSSIQDDKDLLKKGMKKALTSLAFINFPVMTGLAFIARPLIITLFTEKWIESVQYLQLICILGFLFPIHMINLNVLEALGKSNLFFRLEVIKKLIIIITIAITWRWGIIAMIYGMIVNNIISYFLNSYYNNKLIKYGVVEQINDLLPYIGASAIMGLGVYLIGKLSFPNNWLLLLVQVFTGTLLYFGLCRILRLTAFMEICNLFLHKKIFRFNN